MRSRWTWRQVPEIFAKMKPSRFWPSLPKSLPAYSASRYRYTLTAGTGMALVNPGNPPRTGFQKIPHIPILRLPVQKQKGSPPFKRTTCPYSKAFHDYLLMSSHGQKECLPPFPFFPLPYIFGMLGFKSSRIPLLDQASYRMISSSMLNILPYVSESYPRTCTY